MAKCRGQTVAVKKLKKQQLALSQLNELKKEIDIMRFYSSFISTSIPVLTISFHLLHSLIRYLLRRLKSNYIVLLMGLCEEPENISIVMEYITGRYDKSLFVYVFTCNLNLSTWQSRNLYDIIHDPKTQLSLEQKLWISKEIAVGACCCYFTSPSLRLKIWLCLYSPLGCNWLHRLNPPIVHRDLKPDNVMVPIDIPKTPP